MTRPSPRPLVVTRPVLVGRDSGEIPFAPHAFLSDKCSRHIIWKREPFDTIPPLHPSFGKDTQRTSLDLRANAPCILPLCEC